HRLKSERRGRDVMMTLRSYVCGGWHEASSGFAPLYNPSTEEEIARASSSTCSASRSREVAR
ncbi:MAG: hypothetical protein ACE5GW_14125, partial [Planctomycetota bacterium]